MNMKTIVLFCLLIVPLIGVSQDDKKVVAYYKDSTHFKLVIKTEESNGDRNIALDNLTARVKGDTTVVYYTHYGDMLISSLTIPYNVVDKMIEFESQVIERACKTENCTHSIVFKVGDKELRIPIDDLDQELVSSFMLKLEL